MAQDESTKIKIVQQSIERGWVGFFPLKETNEKVTGNPFFDMIGGER